MQHPSNTFCRPFFGVLGVFAALALAFTVFALTGCGGSSTTDSDDDLDISDKTIVEASGVHHILIIGDDQWEQTDAGHSDLMLLARVDFDNALVTLVTIPRDTAYEYNGTVCKVNDAYRLGGASAACKAASDITGVEVTEYVSIGLEELVEVVDYFGSVEVQVPMAVSYVFYSGDYGAEQFQAGSNELDGWRAMALSRARTSYGGYGFSEDFIRQMVDRYMFVSLMKNLFKDPAAAVSTATELSQYIKTNIKTGVLLGYVQKISEASAVGVYTTTGPADGAIDQASGLYLTTNDQEAWKALMEVVEAGGDPATVSVNPTLKEPSGMSANANYWITLQ